jgi:hypothetical protein
MFTIGVILLSAVFLRIGVFSKADTLEVCSESLLDYTLPLGARNDFLLLFLYLSYSLNLADESYNSFLLGGFWLCLS